MGNTNGEAKVRFETKDELIESLRGACTYWRNESFQNGMIAQELRGKLGEMVKLVDAILESKDIGGDKTNRSPNAL